MDLKTKDRRFLAREEREDLQVVDARGSVVVDARGRRYVDFVSGWNVGNLGWARKEIRAAIRRFDGPDYVFPEFLYAPWAELAQMLAEVTPGKLQKSFRATGGTEAVEIAMQAAIAHTGRRGFLSIEGSYHGDSFGAMSIGSSEYREVFPNLLRKCEKIEPPLDARAADRVETVLKRRETAALVMEPILMNLGVLVPEARFMTRVQQLCRKYGTLLVMDEVATGFGRTGRLFGSEHYGIEPDILCMAKAITGGYAGMGATIMTREVAGSLAEAGSAYYSTYGWHPLAVAAAIANIRYIRKHQKRLLRNVVEMGDYFRTRLTRMEFERDTEIRVKGLAIAVEFDDDDNADRLAGKCRKAGLLLSTAESALTMFPPLTVDRRTAKKGLDILEECL
jgi:4-aminobutyrate aminotransferase-like enzyme